MFLSLITKNLNWETLTKNYWLKVTFKSLRGEGLGKKEGGVFLRGGGGETPTHTTNLAITLTVILIYWCQFSCC